MPSPSRWSRGAQTAIPSNPRAWLISTGRHRAIDRARRDARTTALSALTAPPASPEPARDRRARGGERRRGRPVAARLHVLSPRALARGAGGAHAAHDLRVDDGGDRARVSRSRADDGAAPRARDEQDPRRGHSVSSARRATSCPSVSIPCSPSSTSCSPRDTRRRAATRWCVTILHARQFVWRACSSSCCRRRAKRMVARSACSSTTRAAPRVYRRRGSCCCSRSRTARDGIASRSPKVSRGSTPRCSAGARGRTRSRRRSPRCTLPRRARPRPTGGRSPRCTRCCFRAPPTPVIELNHAVAVAMVDGAQAGLLLMDAIAARGELRDYHLLHAARADCCAVSDDRRRARGI